MSNELNDLRKSILIKIDKNGNESVNEVTKASLGLTTYYKKDHLNSTLIEKLLYFNNSNRLIEHLNFKNKEEIYFMPEQFSILKKLINSKWNKIIFSAPTSFGKTLIIKEYIYLNKYNSIVIIVPTNALSYEIRKDFINNLNFNEFEIFDSIFIEEINNENKLSKINKFIFIGTQEKFLEIIDFLPNIDLFIIDEAYKLKEKPTKDGRAYILSKVLFDILNIETSKIILLTPNGKFDSFFKYGFKQINTYFNAVDKYFEPNIKNKKDLIKHLNNVISLKEKTIFFCSKPSSFRENIDYFPNIILNEKNNEKIMNLIKQLSSDYSPNWTIVKLLKKGIVSHNGLMPKYLQIRMMNLFKNNDDVIFLVGTNSISEGINTPSKNLFIDTNYSFNKWDFMTIKNTIGRVGRININPIGYIFTKEKNMENFLNDDNIELSISDPKEKEEIDDNLKLIKIKKISNENGFDEKLIIKILKSYSWTTIKLKKFLSAINLYEFSEDKGIKNIIPIYKYIFDNKNERKLIFYNSKNYYEDKIEHSSISAVLNYYYLKGNDKFNLSTFKEKIEGFKYYFNNNKESEKYFIKDESKIIDILFQMINNILDYRIMPIINIYFELMEKNCKLRKNEKIINLFNDIKNKYNEKILFRKNFDQLSDKNKKILNILRDNGIPNSLINDQMIEEIVNKLKIRFSMFEIKKAIFDLIKTSKNKEKYEKIYKKYLISWD